MDEKYSPSYKAMMPEMISFELDEDGCMKETEHSIASRISAKWGFDMHAMVLMESDSCQPFEMGGKTHYACASIRFTVRGVGWATDFETIVRAPEWDDDKEKED